MCSRIIFSLLFLVVSCSSVRSQVFGGNPSSIKWKQVNTDTARVIYPIGLDSTAKRVASIIHELSRSHHASIGDKIRKVNIVLQNQSTVSNAYVALGPYRSEFYLFAPQNNFDLGSLNWADLLSMHEYRHVQQYSNFNVGISKVMSVLFGEQGQAVANGIAIPDWFFEGDAVFNETSLSQQGRGRIPDFFNGYVSLIKANREYSYMKLRNGSYKDYVPDHYQLGYLLTGYGREKYGKDFWRNVSQDAAAFKPAFYPFQGAVKKYSGITYIQFVKDAFTYYNSQWKKSRNADLNYITPVKKYRSDYKYPYKEADGSYIVLKRSNRQVPALFRVLFNGKEKKIAVRDFAYDDYFSHNNGKVVYSSYNPHIRWGYKEYGDIKLLDIATKEERKITRGERYFSPDIAHNGQMIAAINMALNQSSSLQLIDLNGKQLLNYAGRKGEVFTYPKFSADDKYVYSAIRDAKGEMALLKLNVQDKRKGIITLIPFSNRLIGFPTVQGDTIFFSNSYKGSDEIWAFIESNNTTYRVAANATGFYQAIYDANKAQLISSTFTADGYRLASIPSSSLLWEKVNVAENALPDLYISSALRQEDSATLQNIPARNFITLKYRKSFNLFNFHSWRPSYDQPEFSFTVYGQNILNTFENEIAYTYNKNESSHRLGYNAIYGGWFLQPSIGINQTWNRTIRYNADSTFNYNELNANLGLNLPLNLSGGKQFRYLNVGSSINTKQARLTGAGQKFYRNQDFNFVTARLRYAGQIQTALQQIFPHWAQSLVLQYRTVVNKYTARQLLASGSAYLPGLHNTHSIVLSAAYQGRDTLNQYAFSNSFPFSRGYTSINFPRMWKLGANYHFPLLYPDWGFGNIVYFNRIRANIFYDHTIGKSLRTGIQKPFNTIGSELYVDTKWLNQQPVTLGLRYSHLLNKEFRGPTNANQWEIIMPVNLFNN